MARYGTPVLLMAIVLSITLASANDLYLKVKVKDCKGPVKNAEVEVSECVKDRLKAKTDEEGFAFFGGDRSIQYCDRLALRKCVIKVISHDGYMEMTLEDKFGDKVSPRKYICGLNSRYCGPEPDYECKTSKAFTYEKVIKFKKDDCPKPCIIKPYDKCEMEEGDCMSDKKGMGCWKRGDDKCRCTEGYECKMMKKHSYPQCLPEGYSHGPPGAGKPDGPGAGKPEGPEGPDGPHGPDEPPHKQPPFWPFTKDSSVQNVDDKFWGGNKKPCVLKADQVCGSWWGPYPKCMCDEGYSCEKKGYGEYWKCKKTEEEPCVLKEGQTCGKNSPYDYPYKKCECEKGYDCLKTGYGDYKCQKTPPPPCVKMPDAKCGDESGPFKGCKCTDGYTCRDTGYGVWKCDKKRNDPCVKKPWEKCGDQDGPFRGCKCTDGYKCTEQVYGMWRCKETRMDDKCKNKCKCPTPEECNKIDKCYWVEGDYGYCKPRRRRAMVL